MQFIKEKDKKINRRHMSRNDCCYKYNLYAEQNCNVVEHYTLTMELRKQNEINER